MGVRSLIQVGVDILKTTVSVATKSILVQIGDVVNEDTDADDVEWWQHVGFISRPSKPDAGKKAAQGIIIRQGDHDICFASKDERGQDLAGSLADGETCLYAGGSDGKAQGRVLIKANGSINLYTRAGNTASGGGMGLFIDAAGDSIRIVNSLGFGLIISPDGVFLTSKDAALKLQASGAASLIGKGPTQVDGTSIMLGAVGVPGVNSAIIGTTGVSGRASTKVVIQQ